MQVIPEEESVKADDKVNDVGVSSWSRDEFAG